MFCYADDLILTSLTVTGLQSLIDVSRDYITPHGLNFNPSKTTCTTFGTTHQAVKPTWNLNGVKVKQDHAVTYLGTRLSNQARDHIDSRITAARRAFYGLQGAGLCARGANPFTIAHIYKMAIQLILTYGCSNLNLTHNDINELEKVQASLIKKNYKCGENNHSKKDCHFPGSVNCNKCNKTGHKAKFCNLYSK